MEINELINLAESQEKLLQTNEKHTSNDFYGHATILKNFLGISNEQFLPVAIEHGPQLRNFLWDVDLNSPMPKFICASQAYIDRIWNRKSSKPAISIGPLIHYAPIDFSLVKKTKNNYSNILIVFPIHSTHYITSIYDESSFCAQIEPFKKIFDKIYISLYWKDILLNKHQFYIDKGYECITSGHIYNPDFLIRLKSYLYACTAILTPSMGTEVGYSMYMNKPVIYLPNKVEYSVSADVPCYPSEYTFDGQPFDFFKDIFPSTFAPINDLQIEVANRYWGIDKIKTKEELRDFMEEKIDLINVEKIPIAPNSVEWIGIRHLDPIGKVFLYKNRYFRAIYHKSVDYVQFLFQKGIIKKLTMKKLMVETTICDYYKMDGFGLILAHADQKLELPFRSWPLEMLRDAALVWIETNLLLLEDKLGLIDGHSGNLIQSKMIRPVMCDLGSIQPLQSEFVGLDEFLEYHYYPLLLANRLKENKSIEIVREITSIPLSAVIGLGLPPIPSGLTRYQLLIYLENQIRQIDFSFSKTLWSDYCSPIFDDKLLPLSGTLNPQKVHIRDSLIFEQIMRFNPMVLIDIGANSGRFSFMARNCMDNNATIYSLDNDETALNKLYQFGKINNYNNIFIARQNCVHSHSYIGDVALALALTHHLSLGQSYPFDFIAKQLASFTTNVLITEFMPRGLATGTQPDMNLPEYYKLENFVHELEQHFNKVEVFDYDVPDGTSPRILLVCYEKKGTKNNYAEDITSKIADIKPQTQQKNFKENSNIVINSNYQYYNSFLDINNQWYEPVLGGADTLKNFLFNRNVYEGVSNILSMLEQDEYSKFIRGYIEKGIGRYGNNWQYADICTVLYALSQKLKIRNYLEIGVRTGRSMSMVVANNPDINIVGFDMWQQDYAGMRNPGPSFVKNELMKFGFIGAAEFVSGNSHETLKKYFDEHSDEYFDIITVDGDHSEHGAIEDITDVLPHISIGGIIVFDDIAHPQHKYLKNVWENTVCSKDNFSTFEFTDIGYGVAFAVRKY